MKRDYAAIRAQEREALDQWLRGDESLPGIQAQIVPDPTGNPLDRLQINVVEEAAGATAATFATALGERDPEIIVRNHEVELGYFQLDPCNLAPGQAEIVTKALIEVLTNGAFLKADPDDFHVARNGGVDGYLTWLDEEM